MPLNNIFQRATSFLGISSNKFTQQQYEDGDIVFSKNNVCVHTPSQYRGEGLNIHHPGYMVVKCLSVTADHKTLTLSWIPNERLKRSHDLIHNEKNEGGSYDGDNCSMGYNTIPELVMQDKVEEIEKNSNENKKDESNSPEDKNSGDFGTSSTSSASLIVTIASSDESQNKNSSFSNSESTSGVFSGTEQSDECVKRSSSVEESSQESSVGDPDKNAEDKTNIIISEVINYDKVNESKVTENNVADVKSENEEEQKPNDEKESDKNDIPCNKARYVSSSSESSSDNDKVNRETTSIVTESESSFHIETNRSDDEISVGSSTDLQGSPPPRYFSAKAREQWYDRSAESMAYCANLAFPDSPSNVSSLSPTPVEGGLSPIRRQHKCSIFSVDIGQMKSLRLFFSDKEQTCGQLVIASEESQYKILHFHHAGLDKLASVFEDWNFLIGPQKEDYNKIESPTDTALKQFSVCRPKIQEFELHPEEGSLEYLDAESWVTYFTEDGMIDDELSLRRTIFLGGVEPQLRTNVWPFLLHYYDFRTTFSERQAVMEEKHHLYSKINANRLNLNEEQKEMFWKEVQCTVEKDVIRTDRSKKCFAGPNNPNLEKMKSILLNFAYYNPDIGYTQGMSDMVAPILSEVRNEADVFWCFTGMMSKTIFVTSPRDQDMEKNLRYLCELLRLMVPSFYEYVCLQEDGKDLLFCHRWILLCFKREFLEDEVLAIWEACWANYQTDYFHLFLVVSIISIYGLEISQQQMRPDEMLLFFTSLANHMDGNMVLKKARGLLHQFRTKEIIPCTLIGLCELCGPGMWDSGHAPMVECVGHSGANSTPCLAAQTSNAKLSNKEN